MKKHINCSIIATSGLATITLLSGCILSSTLVSADDVVDNVSITVPVSCTMSGSGMNSHSANIVNGTYQADIGTTTMNVICNDNGGFSIYATGFGGEEYGNNKLVGASTGQEIITGTATTAGNPDVSNWAMKLATDSEATYPITILSDNNEQSFASYHAVPNEYTKVATRLSGTDAGTGATGATLTSTYAAYISKTQAADTYSGKIKYTLVHPATSPAPINTSAILDTGETINEKLDNIVYNTGGELKAIRTHNNTAVPANFIPTEDNTISANTSLYPVYIVFDNTNDAGIMHFYTEASKIMLSEDSSWMFAGFGYLGDLSGISDWDTSNVTNMSGMFNDTGIDGVDSFVLDLSNWDTSNVTDMSYMFSEAFMYATTFSLDLSSWDTSKVTNMSYMFAIIGVHAATELSVNLSGWNTSNVTDMSDMFSDAGASAITWSIIIPPTNGNGINNTTSMMYGKTTSYYGNPDSGKFFTIAQP